MYPMARRLSRRVVRRGQDHSTVVIWPAVETARLSAFRREAHEGGFETERSRKIIE